MKSVQLNAVCPTTVSAGQIDANFAELSGKVRLAFQLIGYDPDKDTPVCFDNVNLLKTTGELSGKVAELKTMISDIRWAIGLTPHNRTGSVLRRLAALEAAKPESNGPLSMHEMITRLYEMVENIGASTEGIIEEHDAAIRASERQRAAGVVIKEVTRMYNPSKVTDRVWRTISAAILDGADHIVDADEKVEGEKQSPKDIIRAVSYMVGHPPDKGYEGWLSWVKELYRRMNCNQPETLYTEADLDANEKVEAEKLGQIYDPDTHTIHFTHKGLQDYLKVRGRFTQADLDAAVAQARKDAVLNLDIVLNHFAVWDPEVFAALKELRKRLNGDKPPEVG